MGELFELLPAYPKALPDDELRFLASLPEWDTVQELLDEEIAVARRLARRGLVKISRWKADPSGVVCTYGAGRLPASVIAPTHQAKGE